MTNKIGKGNINFLYFYMHTKCKCSRLKEQCGRMHTNKYQWGRDIARREDSQINLQERVFVSLPGGIHTSLRRRVQISGGDNIDSFF